MKLFTCDHCGNSIYFENVVCEQCCHALGYVPQRNDLIALVQQDGQWASVTAPDQRFAYCANSVHGACNWLVSNTTDANPYCLACGHNETVPPLDNPEHLANWQVIELAKKRLFYSLIRLRLPLDTRVEDPEHGLSFRFLADDVSEPGPVMTGHDNGIITIALAEADDAERERRRSNMGEPYRTLLGHFRHEIGHHYWDLLVKPGDQLKPFRELFGDESEDYGEALQRYYAHGAPSDWPENFISAYSTAHPWEDFAETWAHYLHIVDTVETAMAFNVRAQPEADQDGSLAVEVGDDPYVSPDFSIVASNWVPLVLLLNNLNRAVGQPDVYPFVLSPRILEKLSFIHRLVHRQDCRCVESHNF